MKIADVPGEVEFHYEETIIEDNAPPPPKKRRTDQMAPVWYNAPQEYAGWQVPSIPPEEARAMITRERDESRAVEVFEKILTPEAFQLLRLETLRWRDM